MWPSTVLFVMLLVTQGMRGSGMVTRRCQSSLLSEQLVRASVQVAATTPLRAFYVVFQDSPDDCLLSALWLAGLATRLMSTETWREALERRPYDSSSEHLMVGSLTWMTTVVSKARQLMQAQRLHVERTSWMWVLCNTTETVRNGTQKHQRDARGPPRLSLSPLLKHPRPFTVTFRYTTEVLDRLAQGVLKGVLLMEQEHLSSLPSSSSQEGARPRSRLVHVGGMRTRRDWFWELTSVGLYAGNNLTLLNPLWPSRPHDFYGGNIYIAFSQKAATIENTNSTNLTDARGYLADTLKIVMEALNATGVLQLTKGAGTKDDSGTWNGVVGAVVHSAADIGAVDFMPNHQRQEVVDFSVIIGQDPVVIFSSAPYTIIKPFLLFQIFSVEVWGCLAATIVVGGAVLCWIRREESSFTASSDTTARLPHNVMLVFNMHVLQSQSGLPPGASARLLASFLMLVALCLCSIYSGSITAFLVIPFRSKPINTVEEMLDSDVIPCARSQTNTVANVINSPSGLLYGVRHRVKIMAGEQLNTQAYMDQVSQGTYALIDTLSGALGRANLFSHQGDRCKYHTSRESIQVNLDAIALRRNSRFASQVNNALMNLQYFGFIQNMKHIYYTPLCVAERKDGGPSPLKLVQVQGAFFVLVAGLGLSTAVLTAEALFIRRF